MHHSVQGTVLGGAAVNAVCTVDRPAIAFDIAGQTFESVSVLVSRLESLADRLVGPVPENASKEGGPNPSGLFASLQLSAEHAARRVSAGFSALERIERGLP